MDVEIRGILLLVIINLALTFSLGFTIVSYLLEKKRKP